MLGILLALALTASLSDMPPNHFDSGEIGSEAAYILMNACLAENGGWTPERSAMCGCRLDAVRFNLKMGSAQGVHPDQAAKCASLLSKPAPAKPQEKPKKGKIGV